jgi:ParB family chromosome partitioning protein
MDPQLTDLVEQLKRRFGAKVALRQSSRGGKIEINYTSLEDLTRIIDIITNG